jgi:type I restriction enzyme S subunit
MMARVATFGELVTAAILEIGDGYRAKNEELGGDGQVFLRAAYLQDAGFVMDKPDRFLTHSTAYFGSKIAQVGDVVITTKGNSTGRVGRIREPQAGAVYSPHLSYWRSKRSDEIDQGFLFYWSMSPDFRSQLASMAGSTDMAPYLSLSDQMRLRISLPRVDDQRAVASILGALDDKIELNRRMNETLEAMARAIFTDWFLRHSDGLVRSRVSDLTTCGIMTIGDGYRAKNDEMGTPGLPFIRARELNNGFDTHGAEVLRERSVLAARDKLSRIGDVAFTSKGTIGRFARVAAQTPQFVYSPQVCFWRSSDPARLRPAILYLWMVSDDLISQIDAVAGQTDMAPYVSLRDQRTMTMPVFGEGQHTIADRIEPLLELQDANLAEIRVLAATRGLLLPKLMSGEVRVKEVAEKVVEAAL